MIACIRGLKLAAELWEGMDSDQGAEVVRNLIQVSELWFFQDETMF